MWPVPVAWQALDNVIYHSSVSPRHNSAMLYYHTAHIVNYGPTEVKFWLVLKNILDERSFISGLAPHEEWVINTIVSEHICDWFWLLGKLWTMSYTTPRFLPSGLTNKTTTTALCPTLSVDQRGYEDFEKGSDAILLMGAPCFLGGAPWLRSSTLAQVVRGFAVWLVIIEGAMTWG